MIELVSFWQTIISCQTQGIWVWPIDLSVNVLENTEKIVPHENASNGLFFSQENMIFIWGNLIVILGLAGFIFLLLLFMKRKRKFTETLKQNYEEINEIYEELASTEETLRENYKELEDQKDLLEVKEEKYRKIFESITNGLLIFDEDRRIIDANPLACKLYQGNRENLIGKSFKDIIRPRVYRTGIYEQIFELLDQQETVDLHIQEDCRSGNTIMLDIKGWKYFFKKHFYVLIIDDRTILRKQEEEIKRLLFFDQVTDLPNRSSMTDWLDEKLNEENPKSGAILLMDLDDFKAINETFGHNYGDRFLREVAKRIGVFASPNKLVARCSGDEFVVVLHDCDNLGVIKGYCENILSLFTNSFYLNEQELVISVSIGVSLYPSHGMSTDILLKKADLAMHKAQQRGKNQFMMFNDVMERDLYKRNFLLAQLRCSLLRKQMHVVYQPQCDIKTGVICGLEALLRWEIPDYGLVCPSDFISLAEECGMINAIGEFVLREACFFAKEINQDPAHKIIVSVNVSPIQLMHDQFINKVKDILQEVNLDPVLLGLEITENVLLDSFKANIIKLKYLKKMGIKIALDDFGTGYSSLTYLKRLPIDYLKLDKSFILDMDREGKMRYLIEAIIRTAPLMGLTVIAEGIETKKQMTLLQRCNCGIIQGYLISKPLSVEQIKLFLQEKKTSLALL